MTAPEVMNPFPTADAAIDSLLPVHNQNLQMVVERPKRREVNAIFQGGVPGPLPPTRKSLCLTCHDPQ